MVVITQLVLSGTPKRLSDVYGGTASVPDESKNIPYRQLVFTSAGGSGSTLGSTSSVAAGTGLVVSLAPVSLGPFSTGPVKLSDLWAVGAGATLTILWVPF